jgi:hypothetical protein
LQAGILNKPNPVVITNPPFALSNSAIPGNACSLLQAIMGGDPHIFALCNGLLLTK